MMILVIMMTVMIKMIMRYTTNEDVYKKIMMISTKIFHKRMMIRMLTIMILRALTMLLTKVTTEITVTI